MIRVSNAVIILAAAFVIFLYELSKKYKKLFFYGLFAVLGFLPQFIYNFVFFGSPISFGYQKEYYTSWVAAGAVRRGMWGVENFFHLITKAIDYSFLAVPAFFMIFAVILLGFIYIRKINKRSALIAVLWFILPVLFYIFFETGQTTMRYYIPAIPPFVILSVAALYFLWNRFKDKFFGYKIN